MYKKSDKEKFFHERGWRRILYTDRLSLIATIIGIIAALIAILSTFTNALPELVELIKSLFGFSIANAQQTMNGNADSSVDYKPLINLGIMFCIGIAFFWSLAITFHSNDEDRVKTAGDINKMLLGFLIGSGKSYLGLG